MTDYLKGSGSAAMGGGMAERDITKLTRESPKAVVTGCSCGFSVGFF